MNLGGTRTDFRLREENVIKQLLYARAGYSDAAPDLVYYSSTWKVEHDWANKPKMNSDDLWRASKPDLGSLKTTLYSWLGQELVRYVCVCMDGERKVENEEDTAISAHCPLSRPKYLSYKSSGRSRATQPNLLIHTQRPKPTLSRFGTFIEKFIWENAKNSQEVIPLKEIIPIWNVPRKINRLRIDQTRQVIRGATNHLNSSRCIVSCKQLRVRHGRFNQFKQLQLRYRIWNWPIYSTNEQKRETVGNCWKCKLCSRHYLIVLQRCSI